MSSQATLAGRRRAERLMLDSGTARRPTGGWAYNATTKRDEEAASTLFTSRCKVQTRTLVARDADVGGRTATTVRVELHLPASTTALTVGDLFEVTTPHASSLVPAGTVYRVMAPVGKTLATARRYDVEVVVS